MSKTKYEHISVEIERDGVATSVLTHGHSAWKIAQYHSSSRAPRPN